MYTLYLLCSQVDLLGIHFLVNVHKAMHHVQVSEIISLRVLTVYYLLFAAKKFAVPCLYLHSQKTFMVTSCYKLS